ncbi:gliding motility-associated C-terminal domain-containing protein [Mucilaginibacter aquariorum]|uniref:gliding motility-associated C-terminal domain-containing protein n=1 Tax=Mucilaginibacter aquariorum TaxID=2967225 RepID=UPI00211515CE|nr:PKD domain-containing protein [Mucilaginibacter aquariorum]
MLIFLSRFKGWFKQAGNASFLSILLLMFSEVTASGQITSNSGSEFWITFPTHKPDINATTYQEELANISVFITSNHASSGKITAGNFSVPFSIAANSVMEIRVPRINAYINEEESGVVLNNRAIHVTVDVGQPKVVVYAHIFAGNRSAASLILPVDALGKQYYSMNYNQSNFEGKNFITLVATEPNTRVFIKKDGTELIPGGVLLEHAGDVYEYLTVNDLTGAYVRTEGPAASSCNRFAVFSGSSGVIISSPRCSAATLDPLYQQCYPVESWGTNYGLIPFSKESSANPYLVRTAGQMVRIVAKDDGTAVSFNGVEVAHLNSGEFYSTPNPLSEPTYISTNSPVSVAQFALSQSCSNTYPNLPYTGTIGDPDMVLLNPVSYNIKDITIFSSNREHIQEQFINVLIKAADTASFRINGVAPTKAFTPFSAMPDYAYLQLLLPRQTSGSFHLNANGGFNAIAYGFGKVESYAYSAGTSLAASEKISGYSDILQKEIDSACVNEDFYFRLTLPYPSPKISWKLDAQEQATVQFNPTATQVTENNKTSYVYKFPKSPAYNQPGVHQVNIIAAYGLANCAGGNQEINYSFTSLPVPVPNFRPTMLNCSNSYRFTDQSTGIGALKYAWDFGDQNSGLANLSTEQNPAHTFSGSGTFQITLTISSAAGCKAVKIIPLVITNFTPSFTASTPACAGNKITFTDMTGSAAFGPVTWQWDFGDGSAVLETPDKTAQHIYQAGGNYTVRLTLLNAQGCSSGTFEKIETINPEILTDFTFPESCSQDALTTFSNNSSAAGNANLHYQWNFGDPLSPDNQSSDKDARHHFSAPGSYQVSLTVSSDQGCAKPIEKTVIISGPPKAAMEFPDGTNLCGNRLTLKNTSYAESFGQVSKLEVYFDVLGQPSQKMLVTTPQSGQLLTFDYPPLSGSEARDHPIRLVAYSGADCTDVKEIVVTQFPPPQIDFPAIQPVCVTAPSMLLKAKEQNGLAGLGKYSGPGVNEKGIFSPAAAGTGKHEIRFEYTTAGNCIDFKTQQVNVLAEPLVDDQTFHTNSGTPIKLKPAYQGTGLTYSWEPATGLDHTDIAYPVSSATETTTYHVSISNGACTDIAAIALEVARIPLVRNTFTPNGDGKNDLWEIDNLEYYPHVVTNVFNRYGIVVFHTTGPDKFWDGRYKGQDVPTGTYYYTIDPGNGQKSFSGYVTVLR